MFHSLLDSRLFELLFETQQLDDGRLKGHPRTRRYINSSLSRTSDSQKPQTIPTQNQAHTTSNIGKMSQHSRRTRDFPPPYPGPSAPTPLTSCSIRVIFTTDEEPLSPMCRTVVIQCTAQITHAVLMSKVREVLASGSFAKAPQHSISVYHQFSPDLSVSVNWARDADLLNSYLTETSEVRDALLMLEQRGWVDCLEVKMSGMGTT